MTDNSEICKELFELKNEIIKMSETVTKIYEKISEDDTKGRVALEDV